MRIRTSLAAVVVPVLFGGAARPSSPGAGTYVFASFTGAIRGEIPPAPCGLSRVAVAPGLGIESFDDVTPAGAPPGSGSFEVVVATTCVAPFYQALFSHESMNAQFIFTDAQFHQTSPTIVLADARLTHVDIVVAPDRVPYARVGIAARVVGLGDRRLGGERRRFRAPSVRVTSADRLSPDALGETWVRVGSTSVTVHLAAAVPTLDEEFAVTDWRLSVRAPVGATGAARSIFQIRLDPLVRLGREQADRLKVAAERRAALSRATFAVVNAQGTTGISVRLKGARLTADQLADSRQTISLSASELTVTDIASGRTASTP